MSNVTVNISFQDRLLQEIDAEAARESRSRSELLREAARLYVRRQKQWDSIFRLADRVTKRRRLKQSDVSTAIREVRKSKRNRS
ncbi:MAG: ribbon-helix-helix protein, CopG family [Verrucomicrobia bacterium]|nr:ribbon-helix-helix protein, CopG family [Verrucomicrobiota bacterium]